MPSDQVDMPKPNCSPVFSATARLAKLRREPGSAIFAKPIASVIPVATSAEPSPNTRTVSPARGNPVPTSTAQISRLSADCFIVSAAVDTDRNLPVLAQRVSKPGALISA